MDSLIGIDCGLTVTKAVVFDIDGTQISAATRRMEHSVPKAGYIERDLQELWQVCAAVIKEALQKSGRSPGTVRSVAATAHGDGVFLLDKKGAPLGAGILSLDSRAGSVMKEWSATSLLDSALSLTGQIPHVSAPSTLLAWIKKNDPQRYGNIGHILTCKDWLRYCLTGTIGTDRTEASTSFTEVHSQLYDRSILELYGLDAMHTALPEVSYSAEVVGHVGPSAANHTSLLRGTPVAAGLHDVTASGLGISGQKPGCLDVVAGTYSINQTVSKQPITDARWFCRNGIEPGTWNNMSISPASASNYEWFLHNFCAQDIIAAEQENKSIHDVLSTEITQAMQRSSTVFFHPYIFGSPYGGAVSGSFTGLHGWHNRGDLLRAIFEGIAFNHRYHVDALKTGFDIREIRLTGGVSRNTIFSQLLADVLGVPVTVQQTPEAAAWGAALCAGVAVNCYDTVADDPRDITAISHVFNPTAASHVNYDKRYSMYTRLAEHNQAIWSELEAFSGQDSL